MIFKFDEKYLERKFEEFKDIIGELLMYNEVVTENYNKMLKQHDIAFSLLDPKQRIKYFEELEKRGIEE